MNPLEQNKQIVRGFIQTVWAEGSLDALSDFWTNDCLNHAAPDGINRGLDALRTYHEQFFGAFAAFTDIALTFDQQVAEGDWVVTHLSSRGTHTGDFMGVAPTGKIVSLATIRIDRLQDGKIAEHRSVADVAGLMRQLHDGVPA